MSGEETVQKKKKRKRRRKHYFLRFLIIIAILGGTAYFLSSSFFNVTAYEISGNVHYTESQIKDICGLGTGKNIFFETKLRAGRDRLLGESYVKIADITRKLPGTIVIAIEEREEYAVVPYGEEFIIIDNEGLVLRSSNAEPTLPVLEGLSVLSRNEGQPLSVEQGSLLNMGLSLLKEAENADFYFERIKLDPVSSRAYIYYNHYYCKGTMANILENIDKIKAMVADQYQQNIQRGCIIVGSAGYLSFTPQIE